MLPKPRQNTNGTSGSGCVGCPFAGDMKGFVPDHLVDNSEVLIVAQNPGSDEEAGRRITGYQGGSATYESCEPQPLTGATGWNLDHKFLPAAGLSRDQVSLANAFRCRLNHQNELPGLSMLAPRQALEHCHEAHFKLPEKTRLIVSQGAYSLYQLTQEGGAFDNDEVGHSLSAWRGYALPFTPITDPRRSYSDIWLPGTDPRTIPVLATYHIALGFRDPTATMLGLWDWRKIPKLLAGTWPSPLPFIKQGPPSVWPKEASFDTEYNSKTGYLIRYSLFDGKTLRVVESSHDLQCIVPEEAQAFELLSLRGNQDTWREDGDMQGLLSKGFSSVAAREIVEPSLPTRFEGKGMSSLPSQVSSSLRMATPSSPNRFDSSNVRGNEQETESALLDLPREQTIGSRSLSSNRQGTGLIMLTLQSGIRALSRQEIASITGRKVPLKIIGQNIAVDIGYLPRILGPGVLVELECSMNLHAILWSDLPHNLNFLGSLYSTTNRWKHLDKVNPRVYSAGDAFGQWGVWQSLKRELQLDPLSIPVYERQKKLIPIIMDAEAGGVAINPLRAKEAYLEYQGRRDIQAYRAQAIAGWPINVRSGKQVGERLFDQEELISILARERPKLGRPFGKPPLTVRERI